MVGRWWGTAAALHPQAAGRLPAGPPQYSPLAPGDFSTSMYRYVVGPVPTSELLLPTFMSMHPVGHVLQSGVLAVHMAYI